MNEEQMKKLADEMGITISELKAWRSTNETAFKAMAARLDMVEAAMVNKGIQLPGSEPTAKQRFSISKALRFISSQDKTDGDLLKECAFEVDVMRQARKANEKSLNTLIGSEGGFFVPEQVLPDFIPVLRARSVLRAAGARVLDGLQGSPVTIPGLSSGATVYWRGEGQAGTKSQQAAKQVSLTPKLAMAVVPVTRELLLQGTPSVDAMITQDMAEAMGLEIETQQVIGTGSSYKPLGVANTPGIGSVSIAGSVTLEKLLDLAATVKGQNVNITKGAYLMHSNVINRMLKMRTDGGGGAGTGPYIFNNVGEIEKRLGFPIFEANYLRTNLGGSNTYSEIIFANMPDIVLGSWAGLILESSTQALYGATASTQNAFLNHEMVIKAAAMVDSVVRQPLAVAYCNDVTGSTV